jgi:aryl-alcohol dehydrogenase-like predicted oxidoreductase
VSGERRSVRVGLGCVKLGSAAAGGHRAGVRLVREALERGVRVFDTADAYGAGASERALGDAVRGRRDDVVIATKGGYLFGERSPAELLARRLAAPALRRLRPGRSAGGDGGGAGGGGAYEAKDLTPAYLRRALEGSLRRLGTDRVDIYQLHGPSAVCGDDVVALMTDLRAEGKIVAFGVGLETLEHAAAWTAVPGLGSMQLPFGVLDPEAGDAVIPLAHERGVAVIARAVFAAGLLGDDEAAAERLLRPAQRPLRAAVRDACRRHGVHPLALAAWYAGASDGVTTMLVGTSSIEHLVANLRHVDAPAPPDGLVAEVRAALDVYRAATAGGVGRVP